MALFVVDEKPFGLDRGRPSRGKSAWAKKVGPNDVDLSRNWGYALGKNWLNWGETAALHPGQYVVMQCDKVAVLTTTDDRTVVQIPNSQIRERLNALPISDESKASAINSTLYAIAVYIRNEPKPSPSPVPEVRPEGVDRYVIDRQNPTIQQILTLWDGLTATEQADLLAELPHRLPRSSR